LERVTENVGEVPVEVNNDIELRRATRIKELSNGGLESPHIELDHGVMWEGEGKEFQGGPLQAGTVFHRESFPNFIGRRPVDSIAFKKRVHTEKDMGQKMPQKPVIVKCHFHVAQFITFVRVVDNPGQFNRDEWNIPFLDFMQQKTSILKSDI
jgi:hypothetical protein